MNYKIVKGKVIDEQGRCEHWNSELDIISIKFYCCSTYYPCYSCHDESANHYAKGWPKDKFDEKAVMCGACNHEMSINGYMNSRDECPACKAPFNPNCRYHWAKYFDLC